MDIFGSTLKTHKHHMQKGKTHKIISIDSVIKWLKCTKCIFKMYFYPFVRVSTLFFYSAHSFFDCINWNIFQAWQKNNKMESEVWSEVSNGFSVWVGVLVLVFVFRCCLPFQSRQCQSRYVSGISLYIAGQLSRCRDLSVDLRKHTTGANCSTIGHAKFSVH